jgi:hypothetical protein
VIATNNERGTLAREWSLEFTADARRQRFGGIERWAQEAGALLPDEV